MLYNSVIFNYTYLIYVNQYIPVPNESLKQCNRKPRYNPLKNPCLFIFWRTWNIKVLFEDLVWWEWDEFDASDNFACEIIEDWDEWNDCCWCIVADFWLCKLFFPSLLPNKVNTIYQRI